MTTKFMVQCQFSGGYCGVQPNYHPHIHLDKGTKYKIKDIKKRLLDEIYKCGHTMQSVFIHPSVITNFILFDCSSSTELSDESTYSQRLIDCKYSSLNGSFRNDIVCIKHADSDRKLLFSRNVLFADVEKELKKNCGVKIGKNSKLSVSINGVDTQVEPTMSLINLSTNEINIVKVSETKKLKIETDDMDIDNSEQTDQPPESFIYLIRTERYHLTKEHIYKIGRSKRMSGERLGSYAKGSQLLFSIITPDSDNVSIETELKKQFRELFVQRKDIGDEYFEGDYKLMIQTIYDYCFNFNNSNLFVSSNQSNTDDMRQKLDDDKKLRDLMRKGIMCSN